MIVYLDTETTGLHPGQICQLSYIVQNKNNVCSKNFFFSVDYVETSAFLVHNFSKDMLDKLSLGKGFESSIEQIFEDFDRADVICSHNTAFDFSFLDKEFSRCGRIFAPNNSFCTMKNSVGYCKLPRSNSRGYKYPKLSQLCQILGISDISIEQACSKIFGAEVGYHDARFDTTAVYLAVNCAIDKIKEFSYLRDYL